MEIPRLLQKNVPGMEQNKHTVTYILLEIYPSEISCKRYILQRYILQRYILLTSEHENTLYRFFFARIGLEDIFSNQTSTSLLTHQRFLTKIANYKQRIFFNLVEWKQMWTVITLFRLIWNQTEFRLLSINRTIWQILTICSLAMLQLRYRWASLQRFA